MNKKILAFVYDGKKFLLLRNNSENPAHGGDFWFTITGAIEERETREQAVKREVKEETNLKVSKIFDLKWGSIYSWMGEECKEMNFIAFVKHENIFLNEEHVAFEWLEIDEFVNKIKWNDDKNLLKKVLEKGINKEAYFDKKERRQ